MRQPHVKLLTKAIIPGCPKKLWAYEQSNRTGILQLSAGCVKRKQNEGTDKADRFA